MKDLNKTEEKLLQIETEISKLKDTTNRQRFSESLEIVVRPQLPSCNSLEQETVLNEILIVTKLLVEHENKGWVS